MSDRKVQLPQGEFTVGGVGYIDGRDDHATMMTATGRKRAPLTRMQIPVREEPFPKLSKACGFLNHGDRVAIVDVVKPEPHVPYQFLVKSGSTEGWVSQQYLRRQARQVLGEKIYL